MQNLIVLCGPMACGKSTLIEKFLEQHPDFIHVDVFNYIRKYRDETGDIEQDKTIVAYSEMYDNLGLIKGNIILEFGTNNAELNFNNLGKLSERYHVNILFCLLDAEVCIQRAIERGKRIKDRIINKRNLLEKFKRPFPEKHMGLASDLKLSYFEADMNLSQEQLLDVIKEFVKG